jgi:YfiH family protein
MSEQGSQFQTIHGLRVLVPNWPASPQIGAFCTTRAGGISKAPFSSLNLGRYVNDEAAAVSENRARTIALLPAEPVWLKQVHGTRVWDADLAHSEAIIEADAAVTTKTNTVLTVMAADCLPVLISSPDGGVIGAAHAGWRGLVEGVLENTVDAMQAKIGLCDAGQYLAWLGPAIGPSAFEVGEEVRAAFHEHAQKHALPSPAKAFIAIDNKPGKYWANLYLLARQRLHSKGLTHVYGGEFCTVRDENDFFSHRRDGLSGRFAAFIWRRQGEA